MQALQTQTFTQRRQSRKRMWQKVKVEVHKSIAIHQFKTKYHKYCA